MKCPFRKDDNGEFKDCYGKECVAYYEYEQYFSNVCGANGDAETHTVPFCRLTTQYPFYPASYCGTVK